MKRNFIGEILYKVLILTSTSKNFYVKKIWDKFWNILLSKFSGYAKIKIHGKLALVNLGYTYPIYIKRFPYLNTPLVELIYQTSKFKKRKINVIDIGAAIGDTALLLNEKCKNNIEHLYCIDGDEEFSKYLKNNINQVSFAEAIITILSSNGDKTNSLIRTHSGTASAQGDEKSQSSTLDTLIINKNISQIDVVKIDVDGFDGEVLKGAIKILEEFKPLVIFEWHPKLIIDTGNNYLDHFKVLSEKKYNTFIWYNKYGYFSFITDSNSDLKKIAEISLNSKNDWHYDIVAINNDTQIDLQKLVDLEYSHFGIV